jgi:16S rRNA processing protein RimM
VYGVRGWVRVFSYTQPRDNIVHYRPWYLNRAGEWQEHELAEGRQHGKGVVARLAGCEDRDEASQLIGAEIGVRRKQLPAAQPGEYYWSDLQGLKVVTLQGELLGSVGHLLETGANDVLVVKGERESLIPFVLGQVVDEVDLERGEIRVDWDKGF